METKIKITSNALSADELKEKLQNSGLQLELTKKPDGTRPFDIMTLWAILKASKEVIIFVVPLLINFWLTFRKIKIDKENVELNKEKLDVEKMKFILEQKDKELNDEAKDRKIIIEPDFAEKIILSDAMPEKLFLKQLEQAKKQYKNIKNIYLEE